jgi:hypothetical protein
MEYAKREKAWLFKTMEAKMEELPVTPNAHRMSKG